MEKLYRSRRDRIIFGVCGGLGEYFKIDSTLIRAIFIAGAFLKGITILIYIVMAVITPEERCYQVKNEIKPYRQDFVEYDRTRILAFALILIGALIFISEIIPFWMSEMQLIAILLILLGFGILMKRK